VQCPNRTAQHRLALSRNSQAKHSRALGPSVRVRAVVTICMELVLQASESSRSFKAHVHTAAHLLSTVQPDEVSRTVWARHALAYTQHVTHAMWSQQHTDAGDKVQVCNASCEHRCASAEHATTPLNTHDIPAITLKRSLLMHSACSCW
jgi:hypothetical protein